MEDSAAVKRESPPFGRQAPANNGRGPVPLQVRPIGENGRTVRGLKLVPVASLDGTIVVAIGPEIDANRPLSAPAQLLSFRRGSEIALVEALVRTPAGDVRLQWAGDRLSSARAECQSCRVGRELLERGPSGTEFPAELAAHRLVYRHGTCPWLPEVAVLAACAHCSKK